MNIYQNLEKIRNKRGAVAVALIDPDSKNDDDLLNIIDLVNKCDFDVIFAGGSLISDNKYIDRMEDIRNNTDLPLIIFPGSSNQLTSAADAILFLSLISGRNPQYLIAEQVKSAPQIYNLNIEPIPTAYILLDGGTRSSVEIISDTTPLPMEKYDIILAHSLAGQYLGNKFIFLEAGSGAKIHATCDLLKKITPFLKTPIIVGGGVNSSKSAKDLVNSGAGYIVTGTQIEQLPNYNTLFNYTRSIHKD